MHLNDKLIRKDCPVCGGEITLEASSLDKKIQCPKCRQTVIIPNGHTVAKPPGKRSKPAEKQNGARPAPEKAPALTEELRGSTQRAESPREEENEGDFAAPLQNRKTVVYCLCSGILKKCAGTSACCAKLDYCVPAEEDYRGFEAP